MGPFEKSQPRKRVVQGWRQAERRAALARRAARRPVFVAKAPAKMDSR